ncbi:uncharacterized protein Z520_09427 [Fonsecaea multimorphosa CBS 102226]|uniref:Uncharacterized protein n=1 Tax=Fonsecaea multimorphosa CBS 102226 TaxID=1442371 RepID=A0A0D2JN11_9EURO|nr:uncharacterized protein Z520_09427 [Fonsecaea multimorphosa CBS 102226]KIX94737.1 hypothetical protein Z520_09427 [Fonsecaea multimorphosa CBS 102226]OAL20511.1 hypothetical protein AYO22_08812 [Fonsecaea multimorphosa]
MGPPTAIVTGGSSGIGNALVRHLVSLKWRAVIADINPPKESLPETLFIQTDISSWNDQAEMFKQAYAWSGRLDFVALNAGVEDGDEIFGSLSNKVDKPPSRPNTRSFDVNITGTYYGIKLAAHYMTVPSTEAGKPHPGGKIAITASGGGIFPIPILPQYTASKHALVGLVRALARNEASSKANVRINTVCPAIVDTPGLPPGLVSKLPPDQITPMSTIIQCFDALVDFARAGDDDWVQRGKTGQTVEGNGEELIWHHPPEPKGGKFVRETGVLAAAEAYKERAEKVAI